MRIALTGARGFIGARILAALPGAVALDGDVRRPETFAARYDVLIHCAGARPSHFSADPHRAWETNVEGAARAAEAAAHLILASSCAVYSPSPEPIPETAPLAPINRYGESKAEAERRAAGAARVTILRLFNPYGRGQGADNLIGELASKSAVHLRAPEDRRDFVHVSDVVRAFLLMQPGIYNVGTGISHSVREVAEKIRARRGLSVTYGIPDRAPTRYCADISRLAALGWRPEISLEQGLAEVLG